MHLSQKPVFEFVQYAKIKNRPPVEYSTSERFKRYVPYSVFRNQPTAARSQAAQPGFQTAHRNPYPDHRQSDKAPEVQLSELRFVLPGGNRLLDKRLIVF